MSGNHVQLAREFWGDALPDWVETLAIACTRTSQNAVAAKLGRSGSVVSSVLRNKYAAGLDRLEERVRGTFMGGCIMCPALDEIPLTTCQDWRDKSRHLELGGPMRLRMFKACNACPRNAKEQDA
jgi:hypothetical protein